MSKRESAHTEKRSVTQDASSSAKNIRLEANNARINNAWLKGSLGFQQMLQMRKVLRENSSESIKQKTVWSYGKQKMI